MAEMTTSQTSETDEEPDYQATLDAARGRPAQPGRRPPPSERHACPMNSAFDGLGAQSCPSRLHPPPSPGRTPAARRRRRDWAVGI